MHHLLPAYLFKPARPTSVYIWTLLHEYNTVSNWCNIKWSAGRFHAMPITWTKTEVPKKRGGGSGRLFKKRNDFLFVCLFVLDVTTLWDSKLHYHNTFIKQPLKNFWSHPKQFCTEVYNDTSLGQNREYDNHLWWRRWRSQALQQQEIPSVVTGVLVDQEAIVIDDVTCLELPVTHYLREMYKMNARCAILSLWRH